ncbi:heparan sulfate glucosamine 3-O-sulfotransferase 1-like [Mizuhopecten yessoensis]|uniref:heparan sulfate glucosamine 3-O-sulfotransferase 1-like n=1 Tax=Mizuhopecten yessoensis TaxID=6573 RepID=UPI000B45E9E9|nr:heparan sulfate glucosamine 3-O-sulfotransferase 1-like [Mizuhopecten yessoensis]
MTDKIEVFTWMRGLIKEVAPEKKVMTVYYKPVPQDDASPPVLPNSTSSCLRFSRFRLVTFLVVAALAIVFVTLSCLNGGWDTRGSLCLTPTDPVLLYNQITTHSPLARQVLPHCIIIGVRKAGTRAVLQYLQLHPDVAVAGYEVHFFDDNVNYSQGLNFYQRQMPYSLKHQLTIEKTPAYFHTLKVPERIAKMNSSIKLIVVVREPVQRLISSYVQLAAKRDHFPTFEEKVIDSDTDEVNENFKPVKRSLYYIFMNRWLKHFRLDQIHVVDGDLLIRKPFQEMFRVETFLGLEHKISKDTFTFNRTKGFFCLKLDDELGKRTKCLSKSKGRRHPEVDPNVLRQLRDYYRSANDLFFQQVHRRFRWS